MRFTVIGLIGWHLRNFNLGDAGKMFAAILGLGFITFLAVYFLLHPFRLAIVAVVGFLFSGLFMLIGKGVTPLIDWFITKFDEARARHLERGLRKSFFSSILVMQDETTDFWSNVFEYRVIYHVWNFYNCFRCIYPNRKKKKSNSC